MFEKLFHLKENNTDIRTEIFAGITTFMTMSYILFVNPSILSTTGMDPMAVFTATALTAGIATLIMSIRANLPIGIAPGMDLNVLFAFIVVGEMGYSWQFAITAVFIESLIFVALSLTKFRDKIILCFPFSLQNAISVGMGLFITFIGLRSAGIIVFDPTTLIKLGDITSASFFITAIGILSIGIMLIYKIKCALLIGILISTFIAIPLGINSFSSLITPQLFSVPSLAPTFMQFEWINIFSYDMFIIVIIFLFVDIFDTTGTFIGLGRKGNWFDKSGKLPKAKNAYLADALGSTIASILGSSAATSYIESASGIAEGGKTGLTSFTVAILFLFSLFFAPIFLFVPTEASSAALILVGIFMITPITEIDFNDYLYSIPSFIIIVMMPMAVSIADGLIFGLTSFVLLAFFSKRTNEVSKFTIIVVILAMIKYLLVN